MIPMGRGKAEIIFRKSTVLYEENGCIRHIHQTTIFEGGRIPSEDEIEKLAHECAPPRHPSASRLFALHVDPEAIDPTKAYAIEHEARRLIELPKPRK